MKERLLPGWIGNAIIRENVAREKDNDEVRAKNDDSRRLSAPALSEAEEYMSEFAIVQWLLASTIFFVVPFWRICKRAGFKPGLSLLSLIPGGILVLLWVIAFAKWPAAPDEKKA